MIVSQSKIGSLDGQITFGIPQETKEMPTDCLQYLLVLILTILCTYVIAITFNITTSSNCQQKPQG